MVGAAGECLAAAEGTRKILDAEQLVGRSVESFDGRSGVQIINPGVGGSQRGMEFAQVMGHSLTDSAPLLHGTSSPCGRVTARGYYRPLLWESVPVSGNTGLPMNSEQGEHRQKKRTAAEETAHRAARPRTARFVCVGQIRPTRVPLWVNAG